jgi:hypothetical protein
MSNKGERSYSAGYASGFSAGYGQGRLAALKELGRPDTQAIEQLADNRLASLIDLENENARLIAKLRGYVLAGSAKGPGVLVRNGTAIARGLNREAYKPQHRYPFVLGSNGAWKRAKGRLRIEDWATRLPPKVCEACGHLFVTGRRDAKTCSPRCRTALHRKALDGKGEVPDPRSSENKPPT